MALNGGGQPEALQGLLSNDLSSDGEASRSGRGSATRSSSSLASTRIGGRSYALRTVPSCHVCASTEREAIEKALLRGWTHTAIARHVAQDGITARHIKSHWTNGHLPITDEVQARLDQEAEERGRVLEEGVEMVMDGLALSRRVRDTVLKAVEAGELQPTVREGLNAESLLAQAEAGEALDSAAMVQGFMRWCEAIKRHCSADQIRAIGAEIHSDPALASLRAQAPRRQPTDCPEESRNGFPP